MLQTTRRNTVNINSLDAHSAVLGAIGSSMDPNWQQQGQAFSNGYYYDGQRDGQSQGQPGQSQPQGQERFSQRQPQQAPFQPARPPSTGPQNGNSASAGSPHHLPPFAQFYPQAHFNPSQSPTQTHSSAYAPSYVPTGPGTSPNTAYSYPTGSGSGSHLPSPASGSRAPAPHGYPQPTVVRNFADYSTSPHPRPLSPTSPGSRAPTVPAKRRSHSASYSNGSWDDDGGGGGKHGDGLGETNEKEPWGMPQDEYRALNPRDKKQVRNRIGARRFRAKRKDYVASLEATIEKRNNDIDSLRAQLEGARSEIKSYRDRLGLPLGGAEDGGLGLQGAR